MIRTSDVKASNYTLRHNPAVSIQDEINFEITLKENKNGE